MGRRQHEAAKNAYAHERGQELHQFGGYVEGFVIVDLGDELVLSAYLSIGKDLQAQLRVWEVVVFSDDGQPHRRKYTYQLHYDGEFVVRYDRDPMQHPNMPEHKHVGVNRRRIKCGRTTLTEAVEELYEVVRDRESDL
jgi:Family of unknown function (DUF6516)